MIYEKALNFRVFSWQLRDTLSKDHRNDGFLRPYRFSVSKLTMILGDISCLFWMGLVLKDFKWLLVNDRGQHFCLSCGNNYDFSYYATFLWVFVLVGVLYISYLIVKSYKKYFRRVDEQNQFIIVSWFLKIRRSYFEKKKRKQLGEYHSYHEILKVKIGLSYFISTSKNKYYMKLFKVV